MTTVSPFLNDIQTTNVQFCVHRFFLSFTSFCCPCCSIDRCHWLVEFKSEPNFSISDQKGSLLHRGSTKDVAQWPKDLDGLLNATMLQKQQKRFRKAKSQTKYDQLKSVSVKRKDRRLLKNAIVIPPMENKIWEEILVHFMQKSSAGQIKFQTQRATSASQVIKDSCRFLVVFHIWLCCSHLFFK